MFKKLYAHFIDKIVERVKDEVKRDIVDELKNSGIKNRK